jgi:osmotically inducible protein OsmC
MSIAQRTAETTWEGSLIAGGGAIRSGSGALDGLEVTWAARTETPGGKTSPEELVGAAHSSCFAMALTLLLGKAHTPPDRLNVASLVSLDDVDGIPTIVSAELRVDGWVPQLDAARLPQGRGRGGCIVSRLTAVRRCSNQRRSQPAAELT